MTKRAVRTTRFISVESQNGNTYHINLFNLLYAIERPAQSTARLVFTSGETLDLSDHEAALLIHALNSKNLSKEKLLQEGKTETIYDFSPESLRGPVDASEISMIDEINDLSELTTRPESRKNSPRESGGI